MSGYTVLSINKDVSKFFSMVIEKIGENKTYFNSKKKKVQFDKERMITFSKNQCCITCGIKGTVLKYEKTKNCEHKFYGNYHVNFYGYRNNKEVMMTVDHIVLKSLGGENSNTNYNTMCSDCNSRRGNSFENLEDFIEETKKKSIDEYLEEIERIKLLRKKCKNC